MGQPVSCGMGPGLGTQGHTSCQALVLPLCSCCSSCLRPFALTIPAFQKVLPLLCARLQLHATLLGRLSLTGPDLPVKGPGISPQALSPRPPTEPFLLFQLYMVACNKCLSCPRLQPPQARVHPATWASLGVSLVPITYQAPQQT